MSEQGIRDAKSLGVPKMMLLGFQHLFAMFGATVLVPVLTGLPVATTLLFAGLGTLLFHLLTKGKVPAFLGSSFAFLGGYAAVAALFEGTGVNWIPYAGAAVGLAGMTYVDTLFNQLDVYYDDEKVQIEITDADSPAD